MKVPTAPQVTVVQGVAEIGIERVDVVHSGEISQNPTESLGNRLLRELDLSHARKGERTAGLV